MELTKQQLGDILAAQLNKALRVFEIRHNKTHESIHLELELVERGYSDSVRIDLHVKNNGVSRLAYGKTLPIIATDPHDARLILYQDLLMNLVGMGIIFNLAEHEVPHV